MVKFDSGQDKLKIDLFEEKFQVLPCISGANFIISNFFRAENQRGVSVHFDFSSNKDRSCDNAGSMLRLVSGSFQGIFRNVKITEFTVSVFSVGSPVIQTVLARGS